MTANLINGPWLFGQIFNSPLTEGSTWSLKKIGPGVSEKNTFKGVDGRTDHDGRRMASGHNSSSWVFGSCELKTETEENGTILYRIYSREVK